MSNAEETTSCKNHKHEGESECCKNNKHSDECSCGHKHSKGESPSHQGCEHGAEKTATNNEWTSTNLK